MRVIKDNVNQGPAFERMPAAALEMVAARFRALGEPLRLRILQSLEEGELSVSVLARLVGTTQPNISKHLRVLQQGGLIARRQQGATAYYSICDPSVRELCDLVCAGVRRRLAAQVDAFDATSR